MTVADKNTKAQTATDKRTAKRLSGAALASAIRVRARVELPRVRGETAPEHRAFLMWAMAGGTSYPNQMALLAACAAATSTSKYLMRLAHKNRKFAARIEGFARPDEVAYVTYRRLYLLEMSGREILGIAAVLDPPADSIPELWLCSAARLAEDIEARQNERRSSRHDHFAAAIADAEPVSVQNGMKAGTPRGGRTVDLEAVKPAPSDGSVVAKLIGDDVGSAIADAVGRKPRTRGAALEARAKAAEAVARTADRIADRERKGGEKVVLTAQDARNVLRSIMGSPIDERSLREVDRELLAAARAASPDAEVRLLSLLATQRAEAEAAAADPTDRLVKLVDAAFGYFARELGAGKVKVTMSSLPMLIKARALLTGGATSRTEHTGLLDARGAGWRDSARVADARQSTDKGALVRAMREDVAELAVILDALGEVGDEGDAPTVIDAESGPAEPEPKAVER
jgi:hypothetical protein